MGGPMGQAGHRDGRAMGRPMGRAGHVCPFHKHINTFFARIKTYCRLTNVNIFSNLIKSSSFLILSSTGKNNSDPLNKKNSLEAYFLAASINRLFWGIYCSGPI